MTVTVNISQETYEVYEKIARELKRPVDSVINDALRHGRLPRAADGGEEEFARTPASVLDHPPVSVGKVLKPLEPRAERADEFFDRGEDDDRS